MQKEECRRKNGSPGVWVALGFAPLLTVFLINLWGRPHYQFFPLALAGAGFLAWNRLKELARPFSPGQPRWTVLLVAGTFCCLAAATLLWSPWLGAIAAFIGLAAVAWQAGGGPLLRALLPALLVVLTIIPPPLSADSRLIQHLRVLAVGYSSRLLDMLGVTHALAGNVIELPGKKLLVDEACSGINSVLITLAGCLFYGLWRRRSAISILVCLGSSLAFVLLGNLVRITLGAWLRFRYNIDILSGLAHELTGLVLLMSYLTMIVSMDQLLAFLTSPSRIPLKPRTPVLPAAAAPTVATGLPPARIPRSWVRASSYAFALLGLAGLGVGGLRCYHARTQAAVPSTALRAGARFSMPEQIGQWQRLDTEAPPLQKIETMGVFSQTWHYHQGDTLAAVALSYPFRGYHDVRVCYTLRGWDVLAQEFRGGLSNNASPPYAEVRMQDRLGQHGALWFSSVSERGRWQAGPPLNPGLKHGFLERFKPASDDDPVTYQVQALSTGFNPLKSDEQEQVRQFYEEARRLLWRQLSTQMQGAK